MTISPPKDFDAFRTLSAQLGQNPLRVQGPGGNTSIKDGDVMWIKASGTELAAAVTQDIFAPVDRAAALAEALSEAGDGSCKTAVLDPTNTLRPSIETTFHAALDWLVVAHTHSIATLVHAVSDIGLAALREKLAGLPFAVVPYAKPGLPLTREILAGTTAETQVVVLGNHGLIICGRDVAAVATLTEEVEARLEMPILTEPSAMPDADAPEGFIWAAESWIATNERACTLAAAGSYYPDHVVFLGPALPTGAAGSDRPALLVPGVGVALRDTATASQKAMLRCLSDLLARLPSDWQPSPIGPAAEATLLDWDAEKYRQALAVRL
ncbi:class II aldolase/adducin family protein [Cognatiyoonia sp. IB215182]|uniref:class II aldolase/adducin family protein n=1 Tax=Cognatiyoonia sp. IB215182 TaxID=3097353 RepID=UPI002A128B93|nr:class II aldolase/adducin family protein [Cognatiyoonia sp. IB215182]MDX8355217.1 class II aldolase/adducin family protein [Cognatiyoonia sp. IB215182]